MKIQIIGTGIVGEATACLARSMGHEVYGYDIKPRESPYFINIPSPRRPCDLTFICVNETFVEDVVPELITRQIKNIVIRSTIKPGTTEALSKKYKVSLYHNPEFLREKTYLEDVLNPRLILIGVSGAPYKSIYEFYKPLESKCKVVYTDSKTSEMVKYTHNLFNATKISFTNEIWLACKHLELDGNLVMDIVSQSAEGMWNPKYGTKGGYAYGGRCLPKDTRSFHAFAEENSIDIPMLKATIEVNNKMETLQQSIK